MFNRISMSVVIDICRICLQEPGFQELQEIYIPKLNSIINSRPLMSLRFVQKWQIELFKNHLICNTCIHNFRTLDLLYKVCYRANNAILLERNKHQLSKVNLKRLNRFKDIEGDFIVCRVCLKATSQIAVYLYDNSKNILPVEYIDKMFRHVKIYTNFDSTINPILCHDCWQDIQTAYSFCKHLEVITEKIFCYQTLNNKINVDRKDLQNVLNMWDQLGILNIKTELDVRIKEEIKKECESEVKDLRPVTNLREPKRIRNDVTNNQEYSLYEEHSYFKKDTIRKSRRVLKRKGETIECRKENTLEMPLLTPNVQEEEMPKLKPIVEICIETQFNKNNLTLDNKKQDIGLKKDPLKIVRKKTKLKKTIQNKKARKPKDSDYSPVPVLNTEGPVRPRTRLSTKRELTDNLTSQDLLVLKKEEIIKKKRHKMKPSASGWSKYTSTPKISNKTNKPNVSVTEIVPLKSNSNNEYTFDTLSLDEVAVKKEVIEAEELQIKKEILSDSDSDDQFTETIDSNVDNTEDVEEECPNLESFIKSEPPDESYDINVDEDEPPELELQGPCPSVSVPMARFTIQNTFTVDEKRQLINTVDDKRNLVVAAEVSTKGGMHSAKDKMSDTRNKLPSSVNYKNPMPSQTSLLKQFLLKETGDLIKKSVTSKTVEEEPCPKLQQNVVVNMMKCDEKYKLSFHKTLEKIDASVMSAATGNVASLRKKQMKVRTIRTHMQQRLFNAYERIESLNIDATRPYVCKLCDFSSIFHRAAKVHLSLHETGTLGLHSCKLCAFTSTRAKGLRDHVAQHHGVNQINEPTCAFCECSIVKGQGIRYCTDCKKALHSECFERDHKCLRFSCRNRPVTERINANVLPRPTCDFCKNVITAKRVIKHCSDCNKVFHHGCSKHDQKIMIFNCEHQNMTYWPNSQSIEGSTSVYDAPTTSKEVKQEMLQETKS